MALTTRMPRLFMMYKLANGLTRVNVENRLVTPNRLSRGIHQHSFQTMYSRCETRINSCYPRTIKDQNSQSQHITSADTLDCFKTLVHTKCQTEMFSFIRVNILNCFLSHVHHHKAESINQLILAFKWLKLKYHFFLQLSRCEFPVFEKEEVMDM